VNYAHGMTFDVPPLPRGPQPGWVSTVPNRFNAPADPAASTGWANLDAVYALAPYELQADEALVIDGRFPASGSRTWCCSRVSCRPTTT
jgi:hypothetical protein